MVDAKIQDGEFDHLQKIVAVIMITSLNGNIFRVTGPLWGESTDRPFVRGIHRAPVDSPTQASDT